MDCKEFQHVMPDLIAGRVTPKMREQCLAHLERCADCQDELEIQYITITSLQHIQQDDDFDDDYRRAYKEFIKGLRNEIEQYHVTVRRRRIAFPLIFLVILLLTGIAPVQKTDPDAVKTTGLVFTENDFEMKFRFRSAGYYGYETQISPEEVQEYLKFLSGFKR